METGEGGGEGWVMGRGGGKRQKTVLEQQFKNVKIKKIDLYTFQRDRERIHSYQFSEVHALRKERRRLPLCSIGRTEPLVFHLYLSLRKISFSIPRIL